MSESTANRNLKVGIFLTIGVATAVVVVLLLGKSQSLFSRKAQLHASFANISGLVVGAPVRLAGVDIGIVQSIHFDTDIRQKNVHVTLGIESQYLERIREDSIAHLDSKGLLGDMIINITVGSADKPQRKNGDRLTSQESSGMSEVLASVEDGISEIRGLSAEVQNKVKAVLTDDVAKDFGRIAHSTANVIENVEKGDGLVHELLYEPRMARGAEKLVDEARGVVGDARNVVGTLDHAVSRVDRILGELEHGDGTGHAIIYGDEGKQLLSSASQAARELSDVVREIKTGRGLVHSLVYEEDKTNLIQNLTAMSKILRGVAEEVQAGKGTVGALLKDPSIYEDLKTLLGNVKRNKLLKALVRFTVEKDQLTAPGGGPPTPHDE